MKPLIAIILMMLPGWAIANGMGNDDAPETTVTNTTDVSVQADVSNRTNATAIAAPAADVDLTFSQPTDYLSLALPGASSDYGSTAPCLESRRGWIFGGFGASGKTATNDACIKDQTAKRLHYQCMQIVDRYVVLGQQELALAYLANCALITP